MNPNEHRHLHFFGILTSTLDSECLSAIPMDIVIALDNTMWNSQMEKIKSFLSDLVQYKYFSVDTQIGFVVFNEDFITSIPIDHWNDNALLEFINDFIDSEVDLNSNRNVANAVNESLVLFEASPRLLAANDPSSVSMIQRTLFLITANDPSNKTNDRDICRYTDALRAQSIDIEIMKMKDPSNVPFKCLIADDESNWFWVPQYQTSHFQVHYDGLKSVFCPQSAVDTLPPSTSISPTKSTLIPTPSTLSTYPIPIVDIKAEYLLIIHDVDIFAVHSTESALRNKLTLCVQQYFDSSVAFSYIVTLDRIEVDGYIGYNGNSKSSIEFTLQKPSTLGWNEAEVQAIYDSYDDARFYGDLARYLGLEWTVNNGDIVTADDIFAEFQSNENAVKRDYINVVLTEFPEVYTLTPTSSPTDTTTSGIFVMISL